MNTNQMYTTYCKPMLGKLLSVVRLDKVYTKAEENYLYYTDNTGEIIKVVDFLGGYGASLFGHNNEELVQTALDFFKNKIPFNAQASCRGKSALLGEKLNNMMYERNNKSYITTLANTGTEAVEVAIKHAELYRINNLKKIYNETEQQVIKARKICSKNSMKVSMDFYDILNKKILIPNNKTLEDTLLSIIDYNYNVFKEESKFIAIKKSFHGKTTGAVQLTYNKLYRESFEKIGINVQFVEDGDINTIKKIIDESTLTYYTVKVNTNNEIFLEEKKFVNISGLFIEPLQGEGGIHIIDKVFLESCRKITEAHKFPLIFDEIQCGMGRTGTFLFSEQQGVIADYYLLSKSLGGGISKISALLIDSELYEDEISMIHSSTFAEDDYSSAIASKALDILNRDNNIYTKCTLRGNHLMDSLKKIRDLYPTIIKDVRGSGLMIGIEFHQQYDINSVIFKLISEQNLLGYIISGYLLHEHRIRVAPTLSSNTTIRLEPSAYIDIEDCNKLIFSIERLCEIIYKRNIYELIKFILNEETFGTYNAIENFRKEIEDNDCSKDDYKNIRKVAFLGHCIESNHLLLWDKSFSSFSEKQLDELFDKLYEMIDPSISKECVVNSVTGDKVHLIFIGIFINSKIISRHMKKRNLKIIRDKINTAVQLAKNKGCTVIGFGGYTSIVTNNCKNLTIDHIALTTGNSLTVAMGLEGIFKAAKQNQIQLDKACFAAIGAAGNIASVYSEIIAEHVPKLILIGNKGRENNVRKVAEKIYYNAFKEILKNKSYIKETDLTVLKGVARTIYYTESVQNLIYKTENIENIGQLLFDNLENELGAMCPIIVTSDYSYLKDANLILGASNSPDPIIFPEMLLADTPVVISDIAVPADTHELVSCTCKDVTIIKGGLVKLPLNDEFMIPGMPLSKGEAYACMSETLILGLSGILEDYSYGSIDKDKVKKIMHLARIHGFELGNLKTESSF